MKQLIGIDIGGTKISFCLGNEEGNVFASHRIATQPLGGAKKGLLAMAREIEELLAKHSLSAKDIAAIGISSPGPINSKKGMMLTPPNLKGWENTHLTDFFEKTFQKPVCMNNDANAAALAEFQFGHAKGTQNLVYLTVSTGMGGGAIVDGKLVQGISDTAAEVGHYVLDIHGPLCSCGLRGCFEVYCGGAALARRMKEEIVKQKIETQVLAEAQGDLEKIDAGCLIEAVKKKDAYALQVWEEFIERLAQGIGVVLMTFNPEVIILGTIAVHSGELLLDPLRRQLSRFAWKEPIEACRIEATALGNSLSELCGLALAKMALKGSYPS